MNRRLSLILLCAAIGSARAQQAQVPAAPPAANPQAATFFLTSVGLGKGADLGGLAGADAHCRALASAAGNTHKDWHAYLSASPEDGKPGINARDRIGTGPWINTRGATISKDVAGLHGDALEAARLGNNLSRATVFSEKNESLPGFGDKPNQHDVLTGSTPDGRFYADGADHTCHNYTSSAEDGSVQVGHFDRTGGGNTSWNSAHPSRGCSQTKLESSGGAGLFYCFAGN